MITYNDYAAMSELIMQEVLELEKKRQAKIKKIIAELDEMSKSGTIGDMERFTGLLRELSAVPLFEHWREDRNFWFITDFYIDKNKKAYYNIYNGGLTQAKY